MALTSLAPSHSIAQSNNKVFRAGTLGNAASSELVSARLARNRPRLSLRRSRHCHAASRCHPRQKHRSKTEHQQKYAPERRAPEGTPNLGDRTLYEDLPAERRDGGIRRKHRDTGQAGVECSCFFALSMRGCCQRSAHLVQA